MDAPLLDSAPDAPAPLALRFARVPGSPSFDVIASAGAELSADRGELAAPTTQGDETRARLTPSATGNYVITARRGGAMVSRTAIVLGEVDDAWDQPEAVPGLVNTLGWEDGASISPDGAVLTVQYLPVPIDCVIGRDPSAAACRVRGPIDAPARPRMPGAARVQADGSYRNGCPAIGIASLPTPVPPDSLYAFQRSDDGFVAPHPIYYAGIDGCVSAFGLQLLADRGDGTRDAVYAFDDPRHEGEGARLYRTTLDPRADRALGTFALAGSQITLDASGAASVGDAAGPVQGNPHEYHPATGGVLLFSDDEEGRRDLFVNVAAGVAGPWAGQQKLPAPISAPDAQESQPFFDGHTLWFRRDLVVLASDWNGGALTDAASWTPPRTVLAPGSDTAAGNVVVVGEPSVATALATRELYFVYGRRTADGTLDLDVGRVTAR